jgi:hypothetical protein
MCPDNQWKRVSKGLPWVGIMSPFDYKILDIRTFGGSSNVSTVELVAKQGRVLVLFCVLQNSKTKQSRVCICRVFHIPDCVFNHGDSVTEFGF